MVSKDKPAVPIASEVAVKCVGICMVHDAGVKMEGIPSCHFASEQNFSHINK